MIQQVEKDTVDQPQMTPSNFSLSHDSSKRKRSVLNKFLSKTYHMIDNCDPSIATWSAGGNSFTVRDVELFEKEVLPKYFNHSKFASFIRQLNFYGFQKLRSDPDLQVHTTSVRFAHEYFRRGRLDLLQNIERATASSKIDQSSSSQNVEDLKQQIRDLRDQAKLMETHMEKKVESVSLALEAKYNTRITTLETSVEMLLASIVQSHKEFGYKYYPTQFRSANLGGYIR